MLSFMTANGLPDSVAVRVRRGGGKLTGTTVPPEPSGSPVNQCPACRQFAGETHVCPPTKLREYAVSEDTAAALLDEKKWVSNSTLAMYADSLHSMNDEERVYSGGTSRYVNPLDVTLKELREKVALAEAGNTNTFGRYLRVSDAVKRLTEFDAEMANRKRLQELMDEARDRYEVFGWNRAFLVVTQGNGHVHKSMGCSTCYATTRFNWRPDLSGSVENEIVEAAGERACTVCYPSAPVEVLARATTIFSEEELAKGKARDDRAAAKLVKDAARKAKAPTASGEPLRVVFGYHEHSRQEGVMVEVAETFKTEVTARSWATDALADTYSNMNDNKMAAVKAVAASLAEKHGLKPSEVLAELQAKALAKKAKYEKEVARFKALMSE
jgi:hypothetical protein